MISFEIDIPDMSSVRAVEAWLQERVQSAGLHLRGPITLKTIPGSLHWHLSAGQGSGTLEVTIDRVRKVVTVSVHANRRGTWAGAAVESWARGLTDVLCGGGGS